HEVVLSSDKTAMARHGASCDFVLDCVSAQHDINEYIGLVKLDGTLCLVGVPENPLPVHPFSVILPRRSFAGSGIGGIAETQEMLEFCAK
ncbi:MAG TPA: hydroxyacid dehydrogenase, partial [Opitutae bacterium]|nr:hydroxyacid dehydrogenase [Opitutae bacterium]